MSVNTGLLYPKPKNIELTGGFMPAVTGISADFPEEWGTQLRLALGDLEEKTRRLCGKPAKLSIEKSELDLPQPDQAYVLRLTPGEILVRAQSPEGAIYGLRTLADLLRQGRTLCCEVTDWPDFPYRAVQFDLGRAIERPDVIERLLPLYSSVNYNAIQLYFENAFVFPSHPELARHRAWTLEQTINVVNKAGELGLSCIPAMQSLGHCSWLTEHPDYAELDEGHASGNHTGVLCPSHPRTLKVLSDMVADIAPLATSGIIHVGMDESFAIGKCRVCAVRREAIGEGGIFVEHANNVAAMVRSHGKRAAIWGDMFYYYPEAVAQLDKDIIIFDWFYYSFERFPRVELFNFSEVDTRSLWERNGLDFWGCPSSVWGLAPFNSPESSIENARSWTKYLKGSGQGILVTQWELTASSIDFAVPVDLAIAGLLWGPETQNGLAILESACATLFDNSDVAALINEVGSYRRHGYADRRLLRVNSLAEMVTYSAPPEFLAIADRLEDIAEQITAEMAEANNADMLEAIATAAQWLAYQYRKLVSADECARMVAVGNYTDAAAFIARLLQDAETLAEDWQFLWNKNRYPDDPSATPATLRQEAAMYSFELDALTAAIDTKVYKGGLSGPVLAVDIVNSKPGAGGLAVSVSRDGNDFTQLIRTYIIEFDDRAARPVCTDELTFASPVANLNDARFVRITGFGAGQFILKGVRLHLGDKVWVAGAVGRGIEIGVADAKSLFYEQLAAGDSGQAWNIEHGSVTVEMALPPADLAGT